MHTMEQRPTFREAIRLPNRTYGYFENWGKHPFQPQADAFSPVNAWRLAEAALLAYADEAFIRRALNKEDLQPVGLDLKFFSGKSTQCFAVPFESFVLVSFRGTEFRTQAPLDFRNIVDDLITNLKITPVPSDHGGKVRKGFKQALDEIWDQPSRQQGLRAFLDSHGGKRPIWFTGHSLGAALATIASDRYGHARGLYTFGSPPVGTRGFRDNFSVQTYRFVNNNDPVPYLPPIYQHVGRLKYIDRKGRLHDEPGRRLKGMDQLLGWFSLFPQLFDHAPIYYVFHTWKHYKENR